jgi:hypothetical protein
MSLWLDTINFGDGTWLALGYDSNGAGTHLWRADSINGPWLHTVPEELDGAEYTSAAYHNGTWLLAAPFRDSPDIQYGSPDTGWTPLTINANKAITRVFHIDNKWIATGRDLTSSATYLAYISDSDPIEGTWTESTSPGTYDVQALVYATFSDGTYWVARLAGAGAFKYATSLAGPWSTSTVAEFGIYTPDNFVSYDNGVYAFDYDNGNIVTRLDRDAGNWRKTIVDDWSSDPYFFGEFLVYDGSSTWAFHHYQTDDWGASDIKYATNPAGPWTGVSDANVQPGDGWALSYLDGNWVGIASDTSYIYATDPSGAWSRVDVMDSDTTFTANAVIIGLPTFTASAFIVGLNVRANAVLTRTGQRLFFASANIALPIVRAYAVIKSSELYSFTARSIRRKNQLRTLTANAIVDLPPSPHNFSAQAILKGNVPGALYARALVYKPSSPPPPGSGLPPASTIEIVYDGVDITDFVLFNSARFESQANAAPGTCSVTVKDITRSLSFQVGKELYLFVDGVKLFGGIVMRVGRTFAVPADDTSDLSSVETRQWVLEAVDFNIWFDKRVIRNTADYTHGIVINAPVDDDEVIKDYLQSYIDVPPGVDMSTHVDRVFTFPGTNLGWNTPGYHWGFKQQGTTWREQMELIASYSAAVYYIDGDKKLHYHSLETATMPWRFVDTAPNSTNRVGCREVSATEDGSLLVTDALVWGGLSEEGSIYFSRYTDSTGLSNYGRWQFAESDFGKGNDQQSVTDRAKAIVKGPPGTAGDVVGGFRFPVWRVKLSWYAHSIPRVGGVPQHIRPGYVVPIELKVLGLSGSKTLLLPLRSMSVSFPQLAGDGQAWVRFDGDFSLSYNDSRFLWRYILKRMRSI